MAFDPIAYKKSVTEEWNRAAQGWHRWSRMINSWLGPATEAMLDQARITIGNRVIDIAAGDGGQSVAAAKRVGTTGEVLATDIAPEFVTLGNVVASQLGLKQLRAGVMDAENLSLPGDYFDAAISRLGFMYLPDLQKALSEIKRVLRRTGRVAAVVFTTAEKTPFFSIPVRIIRERRGLPPPEPGRPGPFNLGVPGKLAEHVRTAGFRDVQEQIIESPLRLTSAEECVRWRRESSGTLHEMLSGLDEDAKEAIWREIEEAMRQFETPQGFESPCELLVCSGAKGLQ